MKVFKKKNLCFYTFYLITILLLLCFYINYMIMTLFIIMLLISGLILYRVTMFTKLGTINNYTIYEQKTFGCLTALDVIYEDDENVYYFSCLKSDHYKLIHGFKLITIKEALDKEIVTIDDLLDIIPELNLMPKEEYYQN